MNRNKREKSFMGILIRIFSVFLISYALFSYFNITADRFMPQKNSESASVLALFADKKELLEENTLLKKKVSDLENEKKIEAIAKNMMLQKKSLPVNFQEISLTQKRDYLSYDTLQEIKKAYSFPERSLVLADNGSALGLFDISQKNQKVQFFSETQKKHIVYVKNFFEEDFENILDDKETNDFLESQEGNDMTFSENENEENLPDINNERVEEQKLESENEIEKSADVELKEKIDELKQEKKIEAFIAESTGEGNGYLVVEVPREYRISPESALFYSGSDLYPIAYFFEEKSSDQIPTKKIYYKMFRNPADEHVVFLETL